MMASPSAAVDALCRVRLRRRFPVITAAGSPHHRRSSPLPLPFSLACTHSRSLLCFGHRGCAACDHSAAVLRRPPVPERRRVGPVRPSDALLPTLFFSSPRLSLPPSLCLCESSPTQRGRLVGGWPEEEG